MSTLLEQFDHALDEFDSRVAQIGAEQWSAPTPCPDWDVRALVAHVVDECRWVPYLLDGGSPDAAGDRFAGDPLGDDWLGAWLTQSAAARDAMNREGALDRHVLVSSGETSARDYLWQLTVDLTVHAWDLARAIGADEQLDHELVRRIHAETEKYVDSLAASGGFGSPVHVSATADLQTQMLALFGRRA